MNLFLHDIDDAFIERGDTLRDPKHLVAEGSKAIMTFDRVLANPPFSLKSWGHEEWKGGDKFGRDTYGCPPKSYGDDCFERDDGIGFYTYPLTDFVIFF